MCFTTCPEVLERLIPSQESKCRTWAETAWQGGWCTQCCSAKSTYKCTQNLCRDWCSHGHVCWWLYCSHIQKVQPLYQITPTMYSFADGWKDNCNLQITFCSQMRLSFIYTWSHDSPHDIVQNNFQDFLVNIWCRIVGSHLCGLCHWGMFGSCFLQIFSVEWIAATFRDCSSSNKMMGVVKTWWGQVSPHFSREVTEYLNANYKGRWMGWGGPFAWPAVPPHLTL
jgi:hypothetical protein